MAKFSGAHSVRRHALILVALKAIGGIILSLVLVFLSESAAGQVVFAARKPFIETSHESRWTASNQSFGNNDEGDRQPVQETWSARYQKQVEAYAEQQFSLERGRQAFR
jgi:hypothetical protein